MRDKITKTVVYEINPDGNCGKCWKSLRDASENAFCMPFQTVLQYEVIKYGAFLTNRKYVQCKACKDYLETVKKNEE